MSKRSRSYKNGLAGLVAVIKSHWITVLVAGIFVFATGVQAMTWLISTSSNALYEQFGWKDHEQKILNKLSPNIQIGYAKELLGEPIFRDGGEKYQEYVFNRKFGYVQLVTDNNGKVVLFSVVSCIRDFNPIIRMPGDKKVTMNVDTLKSKGNGATYYYISGTTANSYLMEGGYEGNPTNYQESYLGVTDSCGSLDVASDSYDILENNKCQNSYLGLQGFLEEYCRYDIEQPQINMMREEAKINTIVVTAPHISVSELSPLMKFGPDRTELRVLPSYSDNWK